MADQPHNLCFLLNAAARQPVSGLNHIAIERLLEKPGRLADAVWKYAGEMGFYPAIERLRAMFHAASQDQQGRALYDAAFQQRVLTHPVMVAAIVVAGRPATHG